MPGHHRAREQNWPCASMARIAIPFFALIRGFPGWAEGIAPPRTTRTSVNHTHNGVIPPEHKLGDPVHQARGPPPRPRGARHPQQRCASDPAIDEITTEPRSGALFGSGTERMRVPPADHPSPSPRVIPQSTASATGARATPKRRRPRGTASPASSRAKVRMLTRKEWSPKRRLFAPRNHPPPPRPIPTAHVPPHPFPTSRDLRR